MSRSARRAPRLVLVFVGRVAVGSRFSVLQMGVGMHPLGERCDLLQEGGRVTDPALDKRMDFHFNAILDVVSEWRKDKSQEQDSPLGGAGSTPGLSAPARGSLIHAAPVSVAPQRRSRR